MVIKDYFGERFLGHGIGQRFFQHVLKSWGAINFAGPSYAQCRGPRDVGFTLTFGAGYRVLATDSIALRFDVRNHMFDNDVTGEDKTTHNIEFNLGASWFF